MPQSARLSAGGGGAKAIRAMPNASAMYLRRASLTTGINSGVNICPNNGLTIQDLDFGTYFLKFFRSILESFHQDYCYFHDKNGKNNLWKSKNTSKSKQ